MKKHLVFLICTVLFTALFSSSATAELRLAYSSQGSPIPPLESSLAPHTPSVSFGGNTYPNDPTRDLREDRVERKVAVGISSASLEDSINVSIARTHNIPIEGSRWISWTTFDASIINYTGTPSIVSAKIYGPGFPEQGEKLVIMETPVQTSWEPLFWPNFGTLQGLHDAAGGDSPTWRFEIQLSNGQTQNINKTIDISGVNEAEIDATLDAVSIKRQGYAKELAQGVESLSFEHLQVLNPLAGGNNAFLFDWSGATLGDLSVRSVRARLYSPILRGTGGMTHRLWRSSRSGVDFVTDATSCTIDLNDLNESSSSQPINWKSWFIQRGDVRLSLQLDDRPIYATVRIQLLPDFWTDYWPRLGFSRYSREHYEWNASSGTAVQKNTPVHPMVVNDEEGFIQDVGAYASVNGNAVQNGVPGAQVVEITARFGDQQLSGRTMTWALTGGNQGYLPTAFASDIPGLTDQGAPGDTRNLEVTLRYSNGETRTMSWPFDTTFHPDRFANTTVRTVTTGGGQIPLAPRVNAETLAHIAFEQILPNPIKPAERLFTTTQTRDLCGSYYYDRWTSPIRDNDITSVNVYTDQIWQTNDSLTRAAQQRAWYQSEVLQFYAYPGNVVYQTRHLIGTHRYYVDHAFLQQFHDYRPDRTIPLESFQYAQAFRDKRIMTPDAILHTPGLSLINKYTFTTYDLIGIAGAVVPAPLPGNAFSATAQAFARGMQLPLENPLVSFPVHYIGNIQLQWGYSTSGFDGPWTPIVPGQWNVPDNTTHIRLIQQNLPDSGWYQQGTNGPIYTTDSNPNWQGSNRMHTFTDSASRRVVSTVDVGALPPNWRQMEFGIGVAPGYMCGKNFQYWVMARFTKGTLPPPSSFIPDFNGDGKPDLVWQEINSNHLYVWFMENANRIGGMYFTPATVGGKWRIVGTGDFNGDGKADLVWQEMASNQLYIWYMEGTTRAEGQYLNPPLIGGNWKIVAVQDMNEDGKPDLVWQEMTYNQLYVWYMNGVTQTGGQYLNPSSIGGKWRIVGIGDFNEDGKPDLVWQEMTNNQLYVWYMNGVTQIGGQYLNPPSVGGNWKIVAVQDMNSDGRPDLVWQEMTNNQLYVWYMNGAAMTGGQYLNPPSVGGGWRISHSGAWSDLASGGASFSSEASFTPPEGDASRPSVFSEYASVPEGMFVKAEPDVSLTRSTIEPELVDEAMLSRLGSGPSEGVRDEPLAAPPEGWAAADGASAKSAGGCRTGVASASWILLLLPALMMRGNRK